MRPRSCVTTTIPTWPRSTASPYLDNSKPTFPYGKAPLASGSFGAYLLPNQLASTHKHTNPTNNLCKTRVHTATLTNPSTPPSQYTGDSTNANNTGSNSEGHRANTFSRTRISTTTNTRRLQSPGFISAVALTRWLINTHATLAALETLLLVMPHLCPALVGKQNRHRAATKRATTVPNLLHLQSMDDMLLLYDAMLPLSAPRVVLLTPLELQS